MLQLTYSCQPAWGRACVSLDLQLSCTIWSESLLSARLCSTVVMGKPLHAECQRADKTFLMVSILISGKFRTSPTDRYSWDFACCLKVQSQQLVMG